MDTHKELRDTFSLKLGFGSSSLSWNSSTKNTTFKLPAWKPCVQMIVTTNYILYHSKWKSLSWDTWDWTTQQALWTNISWHWPPFKCEWRSSGNFTLFCHQKKMYIIVLVLRFDRSVNRSILIKHECCVSVCVCVHVFRSHLKVPTSWNFGSRRHFGQLKTWHFEFFIFTDSMGIFRVF